MKHDEICDIQRSFATSMPPQIPKEVARVDASKVLYAPLVDLIDWLGKSSGEGKLPRTNQTKRKEKKRLTGRPGYEGECISALILSGSKRYSACRPLFLSFVSYLFSLPFSL